MLHKPHLATDSRHTLCINTIAHTHPVEEAASAGVRSFVFTSTPPRPPRCADTGQGRLRRARATEEALPCLRRRARPGRCENRAEP